MSSSPEVQRLSVAHIVAERLRTANHDDGARVALVLEGGGMRGVISAAIASALAQEGVLDAVDLAVGTSAGSINAAAVASGDIVDFAQAYAETFASPEFFDLRRLLRGQPVADGPAFFTHLGELFDADAAARAARGVQVAAVATNVRTARAEALTDFTSGDELLRGLHASSLMPFLGGGPLDFRGRQWFDGGVAEAVPVDSAAALGATHAIVVTTRPVGSLPSHGATDRLIAGYLRTVDPTLAMTYRQRPVRYRQTVDEVRRDGHMHLRTLLLAPQPGDPVPSRLERDVGRLLRAHDATQRSAREHIASFLLPRTA